MVGSTGNSPADAGESPVSAAPITARNSFPSAGAPLGSVRPSLYPRARSSFPPASAGPNSLNPDSFAPNTARNAPPTTARQATFTSSAMPPPSEGAAEPHVPTRRGFEVAREEALTKGLPTLGSAPPPPPNRSAGTLLGFPVVTDGMARRGVSVFPSPPEAGSEPYPGFRPATSASPPASFPRTGKTTPGLPLTVDAPALARLDHTTPGMPAFSPQRGTGQSETPRPTLPAGTSPPEGVGRAPSSEPHSGTSLEARLQAQVDERGVSSSRRHLQIQEDDSDPVPLVRRSYHDLSVEVGGSPTEAGATRKNSASTVSAGPIRPLAQITIEAQNERARQGNIPTAGVVPFRGASSMIPLSQFQVVERLARGGTGSVYLATRAADEQYALKVLRRENLGNEESQESLRREAELLTCLQHPHVVRLLEVGQEGGEPFLVMEFIDGLSLAELLSYPLPMPLVVGVTIVRDALRALAYIHDVEREGNPRGIIHGDVSPQNLLVGSDGCARLIDFGVARAPGMPARDSVVRCKPRYASPELLAGDPLGAESDLFAIGAVLFHVLTGRKLFNATEQSALIGQVTKADIPPPSSVNPGSPKAFDELCLRALQRDRTRRYQRAGDMLEALERAADNAAMDLSSTVVAEWVARVQRSLSQDVELAPAEVRALLEPGDTKDGPSDPGWVSTIPPAGAGLFGRLSPPVRFAIGVVAVILALGVILFAILAPQQFVNMFSR
jgi:serine/threonine-protein kinase